MDIKSEDVAEITEVGELNGDKVKMIKTWGGLHVMVGKKEKSSKKPDALAAASHRALAVHQLEKMYGNDFKPAIMKSESGQIESVQEFQVSKNMLKDHLEVLSITKNNDVDFVVSRFGVVLAKYECEVFKNELNVKSHFKHEKAKDVLQNNSDDITKSILKAMQEYVQNRDIGFKK
jgi:hypothetical protein